MIIGVEMFAQVLQNDWHVLALSAKVNEPYSHSEHQGGGVCTELNHRLFLHYRKRES